MKEDIQAVMDSAKQANTGWLKLGSARSGMESIKKMTSSWTVLGNLNVDFKSWCSTQKTLHTSILKMINRGSKTTVVHMLLQRSIDQALEGVQEMQNKFQSLLVSFQQLAQKAKEMNKKSNWASFTGNKNDFAQVLYQKGLKFQREIQKDGNDMREAKKELHNIAPGMLKSDASVRSAIQKKLDEVVKLLQTCAAPETTSPAAPTAPKLPQREPAAPTLPATPPPTLTLTPAPPKHQVPETSGVQIPETPDRPAAAVAETSGPPPEPQKMPTPVESAPPAPAPTPMLAPPVLQIPTLPAAPNAPTLTQKWLNAL
eukprot:CAMPEP_0172844946 /NCGR_PEP_ID=MMETSP1075-20121228/32602_1 /TAXON_ID=2916 /ORGANISM="Ceratium fusus, Strain PA161109" /LENGTH=313 /DNA_ID=CAMNT_0013689495 /DNA_START=27 /DNA_END=965 /DNA_ORIENTATION=-